MACVPVNSTTFEIGPRDYLAQLIKLISTLRGGHSHFLPILLAKVQETLPLSGTLIPPSLPFVAVDDQNEEYDIGSTSPESARYNSPPVSATSGLEISGLAINELARESTASTPLIYLTNTLPMESMYLNSTAGGVQTYQRC